MKVSIPVHVTHVGYYLYFGDKEMDAQSIEMTWVQRKPIQLVNERTSIQYPTWLSLCWGSCT